MPVAFSTKSTQLSSAAVATAAAVPNIIRVASIDLLKPGQVAESYTYLDLLQDTSVRK